MGETDPRILQTTLKGLRKRFVLAAHRANFNRYARLLSTPLSSKVKPQKQEAKPLITLEQFREEFDPDDFYTEEELIEVYQERFPANDNDAHKSKRTAKWIATQEEALFWIKNLLVSSPDLGDSLDAWFDGTAVRHLKKSGVTTIADLKHFIEEKGKRWHDKIQGIGDLVAQKIITWLEENSETLGKLSDMAHLGRLEVANSGDGTASQLKAVINTAAPPSLLLTDPGTPSRAVLSSTDFDLSLPQRKAPSQPPISDSLISATNDHEAMLSWITAKSGSPHTSRVYRREVERFLLFLAKEKQIGIRDLLVDDLTDYRTFLALLCRVPPEQWPFKTPQDQYIAPRNIPRADPRWRPFEGSLSGKSAQYALGVVRSFLDYLVQVRYISANPMNAISTKIAEKDQRSTPKGLSTGQFDLVLEFVNRLPEDHDSARKRFLTHIAYQSAMRISELANATTAGLTLVSRENEAGHHLLLSVHGKGNKIRNVYLGNEVQAAWREYSQWRELNTRLSLTKKEDVPLIASLDGEKLSESRIYDLVKEIFSGAAHIAYEKNLFDDAEIISQCSPHDFRHSRGRHLGQSGLPLPILQRLLGHSSISTTGIYTTSNDVELAEAIAAHQSKGGAMH